jgi:hypothetical protein
VSSIGRRALGSRVAMSLARVVAPALPDLRFLAELVACPGPWIRSLTSRALGQASPHSATEQQCLIPPRPRPNLRQSPNNPADGPGIAVLILGSSACSLVSALCFLGRGDRCSHRLGSGFRRLWPCSARRSHERDDGAVGNHQTTAAPPKRRSAAARPNGAGHPEPGAPPRGPRRPRLLLRPAVAPTLGRLGGPV